MNVLSLFDGMSCGQIALERTGIHVDNYFSSEIDKYAIKVTQANYPNTIQLGDVTKWREWDLPKIDLLIGGSPCQGFSFAGGGLNFNDPRSRLFFEYADIRDVLKPQWFLLENVKMKREYSAVISERLGIPYVEINSALVSAQSRKRYYWTNIPIKGLPEDKGILFRDIIESGEADRDKSYCIYANYFKGGSVKNYTEKARRQIVFKTYQSEKRLMVKDCVQEGGYGLTNRVYSVDGKSPTLLNRREGGGYESPKIAVRQKDCIQVGEADINARDSIRRVYSTEGKSPTLSTMQGGHREPKVTEDGTTWRKLTVTECERLQTVPDGYTDKGISNTQRYKMLGNGWTVDVISWVFSFMSK